MDSHHERLGASVVARLRADPRILAVLVYGSRAGDHADEFSDLDIGIVTTDAARDAVIAELRDLAASVGDVLFVEDFDDPANLHVIYADGAALELIVAGEGDWRLDGPHRVLYGRDGSTARPRPSPSADTTREDVRRLVVWFWHDVEHVITALGRGELWWAYGQLDELRRVAINLCRVAAGSVAEPAEAYWKVEAAVSPAHLAALEATVATLDRDSILRAALALIAVHREVGRPLARQHGLDYPSRLDQLLSDRLEAVATGWG